MIHRLQHVVLLLVLFSVSALGGWQSLKKNGSAPAAPQVTLVQDDKDATVLKVDLSGFDVKDVIGVERTYKAIDLLTDATTTEPGFPELPCVTKILAVPDNATLSVEVVEVGEVQSFYNTAVPPARPSWKEGDPEPPYIEGADAYKLSSAYPASYAAVETPAIFRDFRIARVAVYPVRYIPGKNELRVASSLTIRIKYGAGEAVNPKTSMRKPIAPSYAALYRSSIFNYQSVLDREYGGLEAGRDVMLCISPDNFVNSLMPFVNWRNKTGTQVRVTKFSDIGANATNPDLIKNYLAQVYHTWEYPPTYVLLAGDYGYIPIKQIAYDYTIVSEDYYVEIDGNDFFPEMMIGRFTHESDAAEQIIVNKIVSYERNPYRGNTDWFKKGAVAGNNNYESALATKRFTRDRMMLDGGFTTVDTFLNHSPCTSSLSALISTLNTGRSFLNYRGEGWYSGWWASCYYFQTTDVSSLNNGSMLTFVTSIGCGVGAFNQSSCFGEQWLELGTVAAPRGAVTFIGPTSNTHTTYNNKIDLGIYMGMFQEGLETPGQALMRGRLYMYSVFGNERWVEYQTRVYCILGDPSLHVWKDVPRPVAVTHQSKTPVGYNQIPFTVTDSASHLPLQGAEVCLAGDTVYSTGYTDVAGNVVLAVTPVMADTLTVLVRGTNVVPYEGSIVARFQSEHVAPLGTPAVVDSGGNQDGMMNPNEYGQMTVTLKNWGTEQVLDVQATLSVDTNMVQLQTTEPVVFGSLAAGHFRTGLPFRFFVKSACQVGDSVPFRLNVTSTTGTRTYVQWVMIQGCRLDCAHFIIDDRAYPRSNSRMDPGETVRLYMTVTNSGNDPAPNVRAILRCESPYISIRDSAGSFGSLSEDSSATNYGDYFVVRVDSACPARSVIPYKLVLSTSEGLYPYTVVDTFSIPVSVPRRSDATGPDAYGYYAYVNDDTSFRTSPLYEWTELSTVGTQLTGSGTDFTTTVNIPFTFRYYGVDYTQVRVSSDGWIAFGSGTQTLATNYGLPHNDNVSSMVAIFWEDLFATSNETGKILYFNDALTQRFIIQWNAVGHRSDATKKETFQIVLYNPSRYPTPTGDGEMLMLYKNISDPGGNTVGIENHTQTVGLQYVYNENYDESATPLRDTLAILFTTRTPQLYVGVKELPTVLQSVPHTIALAQNFPNPFNPTTTVEYQLSASGSVSLKVFDILGRVVANLVDGFMSAGYKSVQFDASNVANGIYFYRLQTGTFVQTRKMVILK